MLRFLWLLIGVLFFQINTVAQDWNKIYTWDIDAQEYVYSSQYERAIKKYKRILKKLPENASVKYKIGRLYLLTDHLKTEAVTYLEEASEHISEDYNPMSIKEKSAPPEVLFLLADAYLLMHDFSSAIEAYDNYLVYATDTYKIQYIEQQKRSCRLAREMIRKPIELQKKNMGDTINNRYTNINYVMSGDGNTMAYTKLGSKGYDVYLAQKVDSTWKKPRRLTTKLGMHKNFKTTALSHDGKQLFLVLDNPNNSDIYVSALFGRKWSEALKLNKDVNSKYNETHASITEDGNTLYFTSDRKEGFGGLDIYKAKKDVNGKWKSVQNLGPVINSSFNENTPFVIFNGKALYFSSEGHKSIGGYDIFFCDLSSAYPIPENMGYPLNTTGNDLFFYPEETGVSGFFSLYDTTSRGKLDIYRVKHHSELTQKIKKRYGIKDPIKIQKKVAVPVLAEKKPIIDSTQAKSMVGLSFYTVQIMALQGANENHRFKGIENIWVEQLKDGLYHYFSGKIATEENATKLLKKILNQGYKDAFIRKYPFTKE